MATSDIVDSLTPQRRAFRARLDEHEWLLPSGRGVLPGLGAKAIAVSEGLGALLTRRARELFGAEVAPVRFPPVLGVGVLERNGYVASFPQLLGTVDSFLGSQSEYRKLIAEFDGGDDWQARLGATDLALASAACHPLFAQLEGSTVDAGRLYELTGECFRHEPSDDPMRFVSFRMREYVRLGTEQQAKEHRRRWLEIAEEVFGMLELPVEVVPANDPFFGRGGVLLAANQIADEAKFEVVTEVYEGAQTAIASSNFHGEHFGGDFSLSLADGSVAQSACAGFGIERIVLALARRHGFELEEWPAGVRAHLGIG